MNDPRRSDRGTALAAAPAPAPAPVPYPNHVPSGGTGTSGFGQTLIKKEQEETLGQLRDRQVLASTRAPVPGMRAVFVHIKVEDTDGEQGGGGEVVEATGGELDEAGEVETEEEEEQEEENEVDEEEADDGQHRDQQTQMPSISLEGRMAAGTDAIAPPRRARPPPESYADTAVDYYEEEEDDDEDEEQEWGGDDEEEEEEEEVMEVEVEELRDPRAQESGASIKGGNEADSPQRLLPPGARLDPGSPARARLGAPGRVADNAVQDNDDQLPEEDEEEAGFALVLRKRGAPGHAGSSQFKGITWDKHTNKWKTQCKGKHLGLHTTEEAAARAYNKYLEDGIDTAEHRGSKTSQFAGVCWAKAQNRWEAQCKGVYLGRHATEEDAARAYNKYLEDGIDPVEHREARTWQLLGYAGSRTTSSGGRNARAHAWDVIPRRSLRRGRTTSKLSASGDPSPSSRPPEPRAAAWARARAAARALKRAQAVAPAPSAMRQRHRRHPRRSSRRSALLQRSRPPQRRAR